jgi:hypothetical protein
VIKVEVSCPHCKRSLMDAQHPIDGHPSIGLSIDVDGRRQWLRLSSLYGSYSIECESEIPPGKVCTFICPQCEADLTVTRQCADCQAPMVGMSFVQGGVVEICSRRGCKKHLVEFEDIETGLRAFYDAYPLFFRGR